MAEEQAQRKRVRPSEQIDIPAPSSTPFPQQNLNKDVSVSNEQQRRQAMHTDMTVAAPLAAPRITPAAPDHRLPPPAVADAADASATVNRNEPARSVFSHVIPIVGVSRPHTGRSNRTRPGTAQTRFSIEAARENQRRMVGSASGRPRTRGGGEGGTFDRTGLDLLQQQMQQKRKSRDGAVKTSLAQFQGQKQFQKPQAQGEAHQHHQPSCRQCFRAGFDCAIQLQNGHGTGARKALQDFVAAGGLDALSGVEDFYEGSLWASQAGGLPNDQRQESTDPVLGQNFVDRLSEVAFGESALSRPVTRGAVQDMLEERSRALTERQRAKTIDEFLLELQKLQEMQDDGMALRETDEEHERSMNASRKRTQSIEITPDSRPIDNPPSPASAQTMHDQVRPADEDAPNGSEQRGADAWQEDDVTEVQSEHTSALDDEEDALPFLADRWPLTRKLLQLSFCALWIFCIQCLSSGYSASMEAFVQQREVRGSLFSLAAGQLAFLCGEGGGILVGAALSSYGRLRIQPLSVIMFAAVSVIMGFMTQAAIVTVIRGLLGTLAGVFEITVLGGILDMSTTARERFAFYSYIAFWILCAQAAGPWITRVIVAYIPWSWSYWIAAIFGLCYTILVAFVTSETESTTIYRNTISRLRMQNDHVWTPEPRPAPKLGHILRYRAFRPFVVLFQHGTVAACVVLLLVTFGAAAAVVSPLSSALQMSSRLTDWQATLLISICIVIGLFGGVSSMLLFVTSSARSRSELDAKTKRTRALFMDEKGIIDAKRPAFDSEKILQIAMAGLIAIVVGLYTLALTTTLTSWIFAAISFTLIVCGTTLLAAGLMQYLSESYYPAARAVLGELLALSEHVGPAPQMSGRAVEQSEANSQDVANEDARSNFADEDDHSLMSAADEDGKRWDSNWAISALAISFFAALFSAGIMTILGQLAVQSISFALFTAILATAVLALAGLTFIVLYKLGRGMRHRAFVHIAQTEQGLWQAGQRRPSGSVAGASAATSTGTERSQRSLHGHMMQEVEKQQQQAGQGPAQKLRTLLLPGRNDVRARSLHTSSDRLRDSGRDAESDQRGPSTSIWPWKRRNEAASIGQNRNKPALQISAPFDVMHVASGSEMPSLFPIVGPATPLQNRHRRRSTLVEMPQIDEATKKMFEADVNMLQTPVGAAQPEWVAGRPSLRRTNRRSLQDAIERSSTVQQADEQPLKRAANVVEHLPSVSKSGLVAPTKRRSPTSADFGRASFQQATSERPSVQLAERRRNDLIDPQFNHAYQRQVSPPPFTSSPTVFLSPPPNAAVLQHDVPRNVRHSTRPMIHTTVTAKTLPTSVSPAAPTSPLLKQQQQQQRQQPGTPQFDEVISPGMVDGRRAAQEAQRVWLNRVRQSSMGGVDMSPPRR